MPRIIITEPGKSPQPYRLKIDRAETKIGRGGDNAIKIEAGSASTNHCVMKRESGGFTLEDLDSTNGIKIDGTRFQVIDLEDGISVYIGDDVILEFTLTEEEIKVLASEEFESKQQAMLPKIKQAPAEKETIAEEAFFEEDDALDLDEEEDEEDDYIPPATAKSGMNGILFAILAILALALGFYIRHYQDVLSAPKEPTEVPATALVSAILPTE
ncbi:MAG: FHA domain-containing protein [Rubritalea sp.]|uniref:FHA domain-containing protein n=1 Tax=Rubritalea sp. TaxID=2109375 RepID=UPI0032426BBD